MPPKEGPQDACYVRLSVCLPAYIEDVPKHVGPNLVFADDDQQRSRPDRLAKASGLRPSAFASRLFDPSGCDRQTDELKVYIAFLKIKKVRDVKLIYNSCLTYEVRRPLRQVNDTTRTSKHLRKYEL